MSSDSHGGAWPRRRQTLRPARKHASVLNQHEYRNSRRADAPEAADEAATAVGGVHTRQDRQRRRRLGEPTAAHAEPFDAAEHAQLAVAVQRLPEAVPVTVARRPPPDDSCPDDAGARRRVRYVAGDVRGSFHPRLYLQSPKCITYDGEVISRSYFEKLGKSCMAKWYRSIRVIGDNDELEPLGDWLQRHGLPVIRGKERHQRQRSHRRAAAADEDDEAEGEAAAAEAAAEEEEEGPLHKQEEAHDADSAGDSMHPEASPAFEAPAAGTAAAAGALLAAGSCCAHSPAVAPAAAGAAAFPGHHQQRAAQLQASPGARPPLLEPLPALGCYAVSKADSNRVGGQPPCSSSAFLVDAGEDDEWQAGLQTFNDRVDEGAGTLCSLVDVLMEDDPGAALPLLDINEPPAAYDRACHGCSPADAGGTSGSSNAACWPTGSGGDNGGGGGRTSHTSLSPGPPAAPARNGRGPWRPAWDLRCARMAASPVLATEANGTPPFGEGLPLSASGPLPPGAFTWAPDSARPSAPPSALASAQGSPHEGASGALAAQSECTGGGARYGAAAGSARQLQSVRSLPRLPSLTGSSSMQPLRWAPPSLHWGHLPRWSLYAEGDGDVNNCMMGGGATYGRHGSAFACGGAGPSPDAAAAAGAAANAGGCASGGLGTQPLLQPLLQPLQYDAPPPPDGELYRTYSAGSNAATMRVRTSPVMLPLPYGALPYGPPPRAPWPAAADGVTAAAARGTHSRYAPAAAAGDDRAPHPAMYGSTAPYGSARAAHVPGGEQLPYAPSSDAPPPGPPAQQPHGPIRRVYSYRQLPGPYPHQYAGGLPPARVVPAYALYAAPPGAAVRFQHAPGHPAPGHYAASASVTRPQSAPNSAQAAPAAYATPYQLPPH